jgi:uncharacterized RDD family membrane protein YckC
VSLAFWSLLVALTAGAASPQPWSGTSHVEYLQVDFYGRPVIRVWQDYVLRTNDRVHGVLVVSGNATIDGLVEGDLVVLLGSARLSSTAMVRGSLVVVAGNATVADGAEVRQDLVIIGGALDAPAGFSPGDEHIVIGTPSLGERLRSIVPWFTKGLLWGRLIVPSLPWVWGVVGFIFIVWLALNLVLHGPIGACADVLSAKPLTTFLTGLLVLLLAGPVSVLLAATVIGLAVVPFVLCALVIAWIIGKVGVARWIGRSVTGQGSSESRAIGMRSMVLGFVGITLLYIVPILGIVTWALVGVFGLGSATLAFVGALRRERPPKPAPPVSPPTGGTEVPPLQVPPVQVPPLQVPPLQVPSLQVPPVEPAFQPGPAAALMGGEFAHLPRATFLDRTAAFVLDVALVLIMASLLDSLLNPRARGEDATVLLLFAYFVAFWTWKGTTIGGIVCNLRLVRVDGAPVRFADALIRALSSVFSFAALGIGLLWILRDPERQAWHDKIAGTLVLKVPAAALHQF